MQKKNFILMISAVMVLLFTANIVTAQQLPFLSQFDNSGFIWNPAMTAVDHNMRTSLFYRQQWINFDGAPATGYVGLEYPWSRQNMSFGGALIIDSSGPISKNGIKINYAYKLEELLSRDDQLSIGISADLTQFTYDPSSEVFNDQNDALLSINRSSMIFPSVGAGIFYTNNLEEYDDNSFYFGLSGTQVYATDILVDQGNFDRNLHWFGVIGTKVFLNYSYKFEPKIQLNIVNSELIDAMISGIFEMEETFWAGLGYSSAMELSFQGGYILPDAFARYAELRIGALANIGLSDRLNQFGPGFEIFFLYKYDVH